MAGIVKLVAILVYIVVLTLAALTGGWLHLDLRVRREMESHHFFFFALNVIVYFQTSVQTSLTLSAFEFAKSDFELHKPLYKAIQGMHWVIQATFSGSHNMYRNFAFLFFSHAGFVLTFFFFFLFLDKLVTKIEAFSLFVDFFCLNVAWDFLLTSYLLLLVFVMQHAFLILWALALHQHS